LNQSYPIEAIYLD
jgi:alpha-glucosidase (family GH31 glycosyl hydrolase)